MSRIARFPGALLLGVGLMYFLDPARGRKRRARIADLATHARRSERQLVGRAVRDASHRVYGLAERAKQVTESEDVPDTVLEGRVRAHLGRVVSHPGTLAIEVDQGRVVLRGIILDSEAPAALRCVHRVPGVRDVVDRLVLRRPDPGEQLAPRRARSAWTPAVQGMVTGAGILLAVWGLVVRRGVGGKLAGAAGGALVMRGILNQPLLRTGERGVIVQKTITVLAPVHTVFELLSRLDHLPQFMDHVREVEVDGTRSRWQVDGPAGTVVSFEAETTKLEPDRMISWHTLPDQSIEHAGSVHFEEVEDGTRVHVQMTYHPPGGVLGHTVAHLLGWDPKARMDDDLIRLKALLENGRTRTRRPRVSRDDLLH